MQENLTERYQDKLAGILRCFDRLLISGTWPGICYAEGMTRFLFSRKIRVFDYAQFAEGLREQIRKRAQELADREGVKIEFVAKAGMRKESRIQEVLEQRGERPGLVHILSAMEACEAYQPWHDKKTGKNFLRNDTGRCLHYYFYFMDAELGLFSLRVPTWCPFRLQVWVNGHSWLVRRLRQAEIAVRTADNAIVETDWERAQEEADHLQPETLHRILDDYVREVCPLEEVLETGCHWSLAQVEYSTDLVFRSDRVLPTLYAELTRQAIFSVKAEQVACFLGKATLPAGADLESRFNTRLEGTCVKHRLGCAGVKMYDKAGRVLRLETTVNNVSFFKHHRKVEHRDGTSSRRLAPVRKTIYSLPALAEILEACNRRYLEFLSALDDLSAGRRRLQRLQGPTRDSRNRRRGFNFFDPVDQGLLRSLQRPEFNLKGMRRADLRPFNPHLSVAGLTRELQRLRRFGFLKKVAHSYRYYLTSLGRRVIAACCQLAEFTILPALAK